MKQKQTIHSLFYLDRQRLHYYSAAQGVVHTLTFTPEAVQDLEIQNKRALERLLDNWLSTHQIEPQSIALVIAEDSYFVHDSPQSALAPEDDEYKQFLSFVPFDDAQVQTFPLTQGSRTLAVSKDFLNPVIEMLESKNFDLTCASPDFVFADLVGEKPFSAETAKIMAENLSLLDSYSFISKADRDRKLRSDDSFTTLRIDAKVIGGIAVFVVLLAVLGFLLWQTYGQAPPKATQQSDAIPQPAAVPAAVITPTPELQTFPSTAAALLVPSSVIQDASSSADVTTVLRVRVLAAQPTSEKNKALVARLEQEGMSVSLTTLNTQVPAAAEIVTSSLVTEQQSTLLQRVVSEFYPNLGTRTSGTLQGIDAEVIVTE